MSTTTRGQAAARDARAIDDPLTLAAVARIFAVALERGRRRRRELERTEPGIELERAQD